MTSASIKTEIQSLAPAAVVELFELDLTSFGDSIYRFHGGTNGLEAAVVWQGNTYTPFPIKATGFDFSTSGQLPRPRLQVSNVQGTITAMLLSFRDCVGAKLTRKRTMAKFLDGINFSGGTNPTADPTAAFPDDVYYIDRKAVETKYSVEFELTAPFDLTGVKLPRRQIVQNMCPWLYRGSECGYTGTNYFDVNDSPVSLASADVCGKRLSSCQCRFGNSQLPFGGFPGAGSGAS